MKNEKSIKWWVPVICFAPLLLLGLWLSYLDYKDSSSHEAEEQSSVSVENYRDFCRNNDFEAAHKELDNLYSNYVNGEWQDDKIKYHDALNYIFNKEALYLFSLEDETANKRITYLLTEIPVEGTCPSDGQEKKIGENEYKKYSEFISSYNTKCTQLLDLAIANENKEIAKKLLSMYKDDVEVEKKEIQLAEWYPKELKEFYKLSNKSKEAAKKKYIEAFGKD